ncbi:MAG: vitamin K epoxide reductase family protein [Acidobacteriaceae bacterium]
MRKFILALAVVGIAVSALAWQAHSSALTQPYAVNVGWNSGVVNHSQFSMIGPIPVAAIGVGGYLLLALLVWFRRPGWTLLFAWIGLGFAAYLSYLEAYVLQAWDLYCVISQCLIALIAILATIDVVTDAVRKITGKVSNAVDQVVTNIRYG